MTRSHRNVVLTLLTVAAVWAALPAIAQDEPTGSATAEPEFPMPGMTEEQMAMYEKAMAIAGPGPEHEVLRKLVGEWDLSVRIWPTPGAEPVESTGTSEARMVLGDRFLEVTNLSTDGPLSSQGLTLLGFDRRYGHFTQTSYDTWATYYVSAEGEWNAAGDAIVLSGTDHDPVMDHTQEYDFVYRFPDPDTWVSEIVFHDEAHTQGKGPHKMVEITARRRGR